MRAIYPFMIAAAYIVPMLHQSSLGGLMLLAGPKLHPLWQTEILPLLYMVQAGICGVAFVIVVLMVSCLYWRRPLDTGVLAELAKVLAYVTLFWTAIRIGDIAARGQLAAAFAFDRAGLWFLAETAAVLLPAVLLLDRKRRRTPRSLFTWSVIACVGGLAYRFIPTTIAFDPGAMFHYFPSVPELLITFGLIAMAVALWSVAVKHFAILPAPMRSWYAMVDHARRTKPEIRRDEHGNPIGRLTRSRASRGTCGSTRRCTTVG